jgi:ATP-dependent protease Clp ATPase subunit
MCGSGTQQIALERAIQCSFCLGEPLGLGQVVAGPRVFICRACINACGGRAAPEGSGPERLYLAGVACSFCNRTTDDQAPVYSGRGHYICLECVGVCNDIFTENVGG